VRRARLLLGLTVALAAAGCVTLTPAQERAVAEVRAMADETARVYGVRRISVLVGSNVEGVGGSYRRGLFTLSTPMLTSRHRDSIVAHELAHYLLDHDRPLSGTLALEWQREQELRELAANAKAVEVLVRVRRLPEERALSLVYDHLWSFNRFVEDKRTVIPWGHRSPCEEIADLLGRFPAQRAWTAGLECGAPGGAAAQTVAPALPPAGRDAAAAGFVVAPYFTDRPPAAGARVRAQEAATLPRAMETFDRRRDSHVILFLGVMQTGRASRVVSRWYDEAGVERRSVVRTLEGAPAGEWAWQAHSVAMWELRPYPGRWTAKVWIDDVPSGGVYSFRLER